MTIKGNIDNLNSGIISNCPLNDITLGDDDKNQGLKTIPSGFLSGNQNIKNIRIKGSVNSIENFAFGGCGNIETVTIPENIINVGHQIFGGCSKLKNINVDFYENNIPEGWVSDWNGGNTAQITYLE